MVSILLLREDWRDERVRGQCALIDSAKMVKYIAKRIYFVAKKPARSGHLQVCLNVLVL